MQIIDRDQFFENFKYFDKEIVLEIIDIFINEYPDRMKSLEQDISNGDFSALKFDAHSLKGVVANFIAPEAENLARILEKKGEESDATDLESLYTELKEKTSILIEELKELRNEFR